MKKKIIAFSFIVWALAAISGPTPARSTAAIPWQGDVIEVIVTPTYIARSIQVCGEQGDHFNYLQLMVIPEVGKVWVATDSPYSPGQKEATLNGKCQNGDDIYIYGLGTCSC